MKGRRRPDFEFPDDIQAGDYWKLKETSDAPSNLTGSCWMVCAPMSYGFAMGRLALHTVREHEDGTISVRPGDGSSNSILMTGRRNEQWHGYIEHGVWRKV